MIREKESDRDFRTDHWDRCLSQPRHEFLNVSDSEDLSEWRSEGGVVPEMEIKAITESFSGVSENGPVGGPYE